MDSVLAQTFTDFECLLINDGSKDRSGEICDEYAIRDSRVRVFHKENGGVSSARNVGLDNATGEWIAFVDSDDWVGEKYLESFSGQRDADLVIGGFLRVRNNEIVHGNYWDYLPDGLYLNFRHLIGSHLNRSIFSAPWTKLFKRKLVGKTRFDTHIFIGEDNLFVMMYLNGVQSIRVLPFDMDRKFSYLYMEPATLFHIKYQQTVKDAVYNIVKRDEAYSSLNVDCSEYEIALVKCAFDLCRDDMAVNGRLWYENRDIERISLRASKHLGTCAYLRTWLMFRCLYPCRCFVWRKKTVRLETSCLRRTDESI